MLWWRWSCGGRGQAVSAATLPGALTGYGPGEERKTRTPPCGRHSRSTRNPTSPRSVSTSCCSSPRCSATSSWTPTPSCGKRSGRGYRPGEPVRRRPGRAAAEMRSVRVFLARQMLEESAEFFLRLDVVADGQILKSRQGGRVRGRARGRRHLLGLKAARERRHAFRRARRGAVARDAA